MGLFRLDVLLNDIFWKRKLHLILITVYLAIPESLSGKIEANWTAIFMKAPAWW